MGILFRCPLPQLSLYQQLHLLIALAAEVSHKYVGVCDLRHSRHSNLRYTIT